MAEWLSDFTRWKYGPSQADNMFGKVLFLAPLVPDQAGGTGTLDDPLILTGQGDITIKAGTAFLDVLIAWWGEVYPDGLIDPTLPGDWWGTYVTGEVILDGKVVLDNVAEHYVSPQTFNPPILYSEPSPATGAIGTSYVQGVPIMLRPLSVGVHTYVSTASVLVPGDETTPETGIIFRNSRTITVVP